MLDLSVEELCKKTETISIDIFKKNFGHKVEYNRRLRSTGGRMVFPIHNGKVVEKDIFMQINPRLSQQQLNGVIKHELAHFFIFKKKGIHRENDKDFQKLLSTIKAPRYSPLKPVHHFLYVYQCLKNDKHLYYRHRKINIIAMRCGIDGGKLKMIYKKHV